MTTEPKYIGEVGLFEDEEDPNMPTPQHVIDILGFDPDEPDDIDKADGVWRTVQGRAVFIAAGQDLESALRNAGGGFDKPDGKANNPSGGSGKKTRPDKKPDSTKKPSTVTSSSDNKPIEGKPPEKKDTFDVEEWTNKDMGTRRKEWGELPVSARDKLADAANSVPARQAELLKGIPDRPDTGDLSKDISSRVEQMKDRIHPDASVKLERVMTEYSGHLIEAGIEPKTARQMTMDALDSVAAQDVEGQGRTLGDHGIHHIEGNIRMALAAMEANPGPEASRDMAIAMTAQFYHDAGYLAPPSQNFLDEGHPRWSQENFDKNVRPMITEAFGDRAAAEVAHIIRTHDSTEMDWKNDPLASAARLGDNLALFREEKLPPLLRDIPGNLDVLKDLAAGRVDAKGAQERMRQNISDAKLSSFTADRMNHAVGEVSPVLPKFTLGMLGGVIRGFRWQDGKMVVTLRESAEITEINRLGDFGQRQFAKFAETYGVDPAHFKESLSFQFTNTRGQTVLVGEWEREKMQKSDGWERNVSFCKADSKKQIVWGVVYAPGEIDTQGDYMTAEDIERACYSFMKAMNTQNIDRQHDRAKSGAYVVENFIVRRGDPDFSDCVGAWVIATHIPDTELWTQVESGELTGYSLSGTAGRATQKTAEQYTEETNKWVA